MSQEFGNTSSACCLISAGIQQVFPGQDLGRPKSTEEPDVEKIPELRTKAKRLRQVEAVSGVGNVRERKRDAHRKRKRGRPPLACRDLCVNGN
jgi:hypothetical protein